MSKTPRSDLVSQVQAELITYLKSGQYINQRELTGALDFTGLSIRDFDRLKRIHFVLSDDVRRYVEKLPNRLNRVYTAQAVESQRTKGEIRGSVDWGQTLRQRYATVPTDRTMFVNRIPQTEYQLPENRLLKTFLATLYRTLGDDVAAIDHSWRRDRWSDDEIAAFRRLYDRNVHLNRIDSGADTPLDGRERSAARRSRQPLYYEAYELYERYRSLLAGEFDDPDVAAILKNTIVVPETDTLYELYCLFVIVGQLWKQYDVELLPTDVDTAAIARLASDGRTAHVYHDRTGNLQFREDGEVLGGNTELSGGPTSIARTFAKSNSDSVDTRGTESGTGFEHRLRRAREGHRRFFKRDRPRPLYSGRPDLLFEIYSGDESESSNETLEHVIIAEVKHTANETTFSNGVAELFEYVTFARCMEGQYLLESSSIDIEGMILTDGVRTGAPRERVTHANPSSTTGAKTAAAVIRQTLEGE